MRNVIREVRDRRGLRPCWTPEEGWHDPLVTCVDCDAEYDDIGVASRGYPPLCSKCFTDRLKAGR